MSYAIILPVVIAQSKILRWVDFSLLAIFDVFFFTDRCVDLCLGFLNAQGFVEPDLVEVISKNISSSFYFELVYTFGPFFMNPTENDSLYYLAFKFPRYLRLMESAAVF